MRHDEATLLAFLDGTLPAQKAQAFDAHLLHCETCWAAVGEDRRGREGVETLREVAPPELRDRVRIAVGAAARGGPPVRVAPRQRCLRQAVLSATGAALLVAVAPLLAYWIDSGVVPADPPSVAAVVELARLNRSTSPTGDADRLGAGGEFPPIGNRGEGLWITRHLLDGRLVVVAASDRPFPMPADARLVGSGPGAPWLATRGDIGLACFSHPTHLLIAGPLPAQRLTELPAILRLGLIQGDSAP